MSLFANHNCHMDESWEVTNEVGLGSGFGYFAKTFGFHRSSTFPNAGFEANY